MTMSDESGLPPIGFVGIGAMGSVMAGHILSSGRNVLGWDQRAEAVEPLVQAGGRAAATLDEVCAAPVVISMVTGDAGTRELAFGAGAMIEKLRPGAIHIAMSTITPAMSRELSDAHAAHGQRYLAASVFGRPEAAIAAQLLVNGSGEKDVYEAARPILALLGEPRWVGPEPEQAMLVKLIGNSMIYTAVESMREMFTFLRAGGISEAVARDVLVDSLLPGPIYAGYARDYVADPSSIHAIPIGGSINGVCLETADKLGVDLPLIRFMQQNIFQDGYP